MCAIAFAGTNGPKAVLCIAHNAHTVKTIRQALSLCVRAIVTRTVATPWRVRAILRDATFKRGAGYSTFVIAIKAAQYVGHLQRDTRTVPHTACALTSFDRYVTPLLDLFKKPQDIIHVSC